jgi:hypothetical protein
MLPGLVLIGFGRRRRLWPPLPTILLWPLWLAGWLVWLLLAAVDASWHRPLRQALTLGYHLSGLRVDVTPADGERIYVRMF